MILGLESTPKGVEHNGHFAHVCICPVGIEPASCALRAQRPAVVERADELARQFDGKKMMLGVDALDPTKGLVHKFLAVEELFAAHPGIAETVVFVQVGIAKGRNGITQLQRQEQP